MHCASLGADFLVYIDRSPSPAPSECSLGAFFVCVVIKGLNGFIENASQLSALNYFFRL
tara:strand:- start:365 stop:541 length:177 start_codon:yes stop_codon:yes gene_type:complete